MNFLRQFVDALLYPLRAMLTAPGSISSAARKLASISIPALISILTAIFMALVVIAYIFAQGNESIERSYAYRITELLTLIALIIVVPIVLYYVLRLWLEGEVSQYPDIDYAWDAGLAELRAHGLDLQYTPLFLILGSPGELQEKSLFNAAQMPLRLREIPVGAAALHWFAEPHGVYLVCTDVGCLSKLAAVAKRIADEVKSNTGGSPRPVDIRGTMIPDASLPANLRGTIVLDQGTQKSGPTVASNVFAEAASKSPPNFRGTMLISSGEEEVAVPRSDRSPAILSQEAQREQELRLEYLCRLIVKAREPLAPINGVLTLLPYSIVQSSELQRIVKRDLATLVRSLQLRCPVVSLVTGMEEESGFRELVRRVGRDAAMAMRFGKGFSLGNPAIPEQLEAVAAHACGLFEAKIYELFREKGSLSKPGNTKLYALLCKIRSSVRSPLTDVLANGYARDLDNRGNSDPPSLLFSGCYFAATGEADDRQAFVKAVFEKLPAEQEELEWTDAALAQEDRYRGWAQRIAWLDAILLISLLIMGVYKLVSMQSS